MALVPYLTLFTKSQPLCLAYGMTESVNLTYNKGDVDLLTITIQFGITMLPPQPIFSDETDFDVVDSVGKLFPGVEARVLREDGSETDVNEAGELYVRSERVALGYWNNEKATQETFVDGWVRTGDLVRVDQNECFL